MNTFDTILVVILGLFMFAGWRSGFLKKVIALACLALSLILATKYASSFGEMVLVPMGISAGESTDLLFSHHCRGNHGCPGDRLQNSHQKVGRRNVEQGGRAYHGVGRRRNFPEPDCHLL